jgi:hypothetical protein
LKSFTNPKVGETDTEIIQKANHNIFQNVRMVAVWVGGAGTVYCLE